MDLGVEQAFGLWAVPAEWISPEKQTTGHVIYCHLLLLVIVVFTTGNQCI